MEVKEAVRTSIQNFSDVFPVEMRDDLRLEEVTLSDDEQTWSTTVSFRNPDSADVQTPRANDLAAMLGVDTRRTRLYKTVQIRSADGKLLGIVNAK